MVSEIVVFAVRKHPNKKNIEDTSATDENADTTNTLDQMRMANDGDDNDDDGNNDDNDRQHYYKTVVRIDSACSHASTISILRGRRRTCRFGFGSTNSNRMFCLISLAL